MAEVKLDDAQMRDIIAKAVIDSLTPERRAELLGQAVKSLLEDNPDKRDGYYSDKRSRLQRAFDDAVGRVATEVALEHARSPEIVAACKKLVEAAAAKALAIDGEAFDALANRMADQIRKAITGERY